MTQRILLATLLAAFNLATCVAQEKQPRLRGAAGRAGG